MRAWQCRAQEIPARARPSHPAELIARMALSFEIQARFWRALGSKRRGVCQFHVPGAPLPDWFVELDARGARIGGGIHPAPAAVWRSEARVLVRLMRGEAGPELLDAGELGLEGDLELLSALFSGLTSRL